MIDVNLIYNHWGIKFIGVYSIPDKVVVILLSLPVVYFSSSSVQSPSSDQRFLTFNDWLSSYLPSAVYKG